MFRCCRKPQISFLVPFRPTPSEPHRLRVWTWLRRYYRINFPHAEIIVGHSRGIVFSKTEAINDAASRSRGKILVLLDADAYLRPQDIQHCVDAIIASERRGHPLWFVPYRRLYRLTEQSTYEVLRSDPCNPRMFTSPPLPWEIERGNAAAYGHQYGALVQILSRKAFELVGGMPEGFEGWGSEDASFMRAVDTLYGKHKTLKTDALHLWHQRIGNTTLTRMWAGQTTPGGNNRIGSVYNRATGDRVKMRALVGEPKRFGTGCIRGFFKRIWRWLKKLLKVIRDLSSNTFS